MSLVNKAYLAGLVAVLVIAATAGVPAAAPPTKPQPVRTPVVRTVSPAPSRPLLPGSFPASVKSPAQPPAKAATPPSSALPSVQAQALPSLVYSYNPKGKPDPFKPFVQLDADLRKKQAEKQKAFIPRTPLQVHPVEQYRLVGIAGDAKSRVAMVQDATGKFYPLSVGTYLGNRNGKVIEITGNRVVVGEKEAVGRKGSRLQKKVLQLATSLVTEQKKEVEP